MSQPSPSLSAAVLLAFCAAAAPAFGAAPVDYLREVKPILSTKCFVCHGNDHKKGDLRLDSAPAIMKGGDSGPAVIPGKSAESLLLQTVLGTAEDIKRMPLKKPPLSEGEIAILRNWIDQGAKAPADERHWSFIPPARPAEPAVKDSAWPRNAIDRFILARLEQEKIAPSPEADRLTLLRRAKLDLIGLPPTIDETDAFLADPRPDAYERVVDRFLASPHYGERWGRHWLDVARYADSNGYSIDAPRSIWKYRDWVIDALNRDLPFDQFTIEQLAGRPAAQRHARAENRHRLPPQHADQPGGRHRQGTVPHRVALRPRGHHRHRVGSASPSAARSATITNSIRSPRSEYYQSLRLLQQLRTNRDRAWPRPRDWSSASACAHEIAAREAELAAYVKEHDVWARMPAWETALTDDARAKLAADVQAGLQIALRKTHGQAEARHPP